MESDPVEVNVTLIADEYVPATGFPVGVLGATLSNVLLNCAAARLGLLDPSIAAPAPTSTVTAPCPAGVILKV